MEIRVREAAEVDLGSILSIYRSSGLDDRATLDLKGAQARFRKMSSYPWYKLYVAEAESRPVGTFALLIMDNLANGGAPSGVVEDVAVVPEAQGRGVGRAMMHVAADLCRREGCYKMHLSSNEARGRAHRFFEALGFTRHGYSFRLELDQSRESPAAPAPGETRRGPRSA